MAMLKETIKIGELELKNRLVMAPMATETSDDGYVTQAQVDYYDEKSAGGHIGLIVLEHHYINKAGKASPGQASVSRDSDIEGLKKIADVIHKNGSKAFVQISHAGCYTKEDWTGGQLLGPSAVPGLPIGGKTFTDIPREMTKEDIEQLKEDFANAAVRVKRAGFDGVEIHAAHIYLLSQFYSPLLNKRTDKYGGTLDGRTKLHREVIRAVRMAVGPDFPVSVRFGARDYIEGGAPAHDAPIAARMFETAGADMISISGGLSGYSNPERKGEPGYFSELSIAVKEAVDIPVLLTGGIRKGEDAERLLREGAADMIGVGRTILKDSGWAGRTMEELE